MGQTLAEKIICRAAGRDTVRPGEILTCRVDLAMVHDASGPRRIGPMLERLGAGVWDPDKLVVISDHYVPAVDAASTAILDVTRKWVAQAGVRNFYDMQGICHVVLPERGHLRPGMFVAGGDSHSTTGGAFGCFMFGLAPPTWPACWLPARPGSACPRPSACAGPGGSGAGSRPRT